MIERLIEFSDRVRRAQTLFNRLSNLNPEAPTNFEELRTDCGLVSSEWKHIMSRAVEESEPVQSSEGARKLEELVAELEVEASEELGTLDYIEDDEQPHYDDEEEFKESDIIDMEENMKAGSHGAMKPQASVSDDEEFLDDLGQEDLIIEEDEDEDEDEDEEEPLYEPTTYKCNICSKTYKKHKVHSWRKNKCNETNDHFFIRPTSATWKRSITRHRRNHRSWSVISAA